MSNLKIVKKLVSSSKYGIKCPRTMKPEGITVHNTANDASALNEITYMIGNNNQVSFHYAVDDKQAVQGIPLNRIAWHASDGGSGYGNTKTIGIEICYSKSGGSRFIAAEKNAATLIAQLMKTYGWSKSDLGGKRINTHKYRSGKVCPHRTIKLGMTRFWDLVKKEFDALSGTTSKPPSPGAPSANKNEITNIKNQMREITTSGLNIRKDAGTEFGAVGVYKKGAQITVTHTKMSKDGKTKWGKTPKGWISLDGKYSRVMAGVVDVKNYRVKIKTALNYRKYAGTSKSAVVKGVYKKGTVVTITHTKKIGTQTWGKTSKGWISVNKKYVSKV